MSKYDVDYEAVELIIEVNCNLESDYESGVAVGYEMARDAIRDALAKAYLAGRNEKGTP